MIERRRAARLCVAAACVCVLAGAAAAGAASRSSVPLHKVATPLPEIAFSDETGERLTLDRWRGRIILLNIWATWCGPCRKEMPTLDRLQALLGGDRFSVVALSIDRAGPGPVRRFYDEIGIKHLPIFIDQEGDAAASLGIPGLPATLLLDRDGREIGRLLGPAEWDSPEMIAFLRGRIPDQSGALPSPAKTAEIPSQTFMQTNHAPKGAAQ